MAVLVDGNGATYSNATFDDAMNMIWLSNQNNLADIPSNYTILDTSVLNFVGSSAHGNIDADGYFHAGSISPGGQAVSVVTDDGRILVAFAGTNDDADLTSVFSFGDGSYLDGFERYLESVANYASANGYTIDLVTGKSLGGAATNILFERTDIANGAFTDAKFFGMAASYIADNSPNLINFGYDNDYAYRFYQDDYPFGGNLESPDPSGPENLVYYNPEYASSSWSAFNDLSSHQYRDVETGMDLVTTSPFSQMMEQDDLIVIGGAESWQDFEILMDRALNRTGVSTDRTFFLSQDYHNEIVYGTALHDYALLGQGNDSFYGFAGNDVIYGEGGTDLLYGGGGDDFLDGGAFHDTLDGGAGNDTLIAGSGNNTLIGGTGNDLFYLSSGDNADGGDDRDTFVITLENFNSNGLTITGGTGSGLANDADDFDRIILADGLSIVDNSLTYTFDNDQSQSISGSVQITNGTQVATLTFSEIESATFYNPVCFVRGTMIETIQGLKPIETLKAGDLVLTADHDYKPMAWIGSQKIDRSRLEKHPELLPICIRKNALGPGCPSADLYVSPQHRILIKSKIIKKMFDKAEVLIAAKHLDLVDGIDVAQCDEVEYFHMLFDQHEVVFANGAATESLFTGPDALESLSKDAKDEIFAIFPQLRKQSAFDLASARFIPLGHASKRAVLRHVKNQKPLVGEIF